MYLEIQTDDQALALKLLREHCESAEPVLVTMSKPGDLYKLTLVQKPEPSVI